MIRNFSLSLTRIATIAHYITLSLTELYYRSLFVIIFIFLIQQAKFRNSGLSLKPIAIIANYYHPLYRSLLFFVFSVFHTGG